MHASRWILLLALPGWLQAAKKADHASAIQWVAGAPGSTFSQTTDGKYVYGLRNEDLAIFMTVDSQELEKVRRRPLPLLFIHLEVHYSGPKSAELTTNHISFEFVNHHQVVTAALDPDELSARIQADIENLTDSTKRGERKHPRSRQQLESLLQAHLKDMTDLVGFTSLYGLRDAVLNSGNPTTGGWVFFDAKNKWIGKWRLPEAFVLRLPVGSTTFEFPFALPPQKGDLILRRREP